MQSAGCCLESTCAESCDARCLWRGTRYFLNGIVSPRSIGLVGLFVLNTMVFTEHLCSHVRSQGIDLGGEQSPYKAAGLFLLEAKRGPNPPIIVCLGW